MAVRDVRPEPVVLIFAVGGAHNDTWFGLAVAAAILALCAPAIARRARDRSPQRRSRSRPVMLCVRADRQHPIGGGCSSGWPRARRRASLALASFGFSLERTATRCSPHATRAPQPAQRFDAVRSLTCRRRFARASIAALRSRAGRALGRLRGCRGLTDTAGDVSRCLGASAGCCRGTRLGPVASRSVSTSRRVKAGALIGRPTAWRSRSCERRPAVPVGPLVPVARRAGATGGTSEIAQSGLIPQLASVLAITS